MNEKIIEQFKIFYEREEMIEQLTSKPFIHEYSYYELHFLDFVGKTKHPKASSAATSLGLTRGAASKISKRLLTKGDIESYQLQGNQKEVYYRLTPQGQKIYDAHIDSHGAWQARDLTFLKGVSNETKEVVLHFITDFNEYLQECIEAEEMEK